MASFSFFDPASAVTAVLPGADAAFGSGAPPGVPPAVVDPTDIVALVLMALFAMRRMEVRTTDARAFPQVPRAAFDAWQRRAMHARNVSVNACFAKFFLNNLWFYGMRAHVTIDTLKTVGAVLFFGWLAAIAYAFWLSSGANTMAKRLGIVIGRRIIEEPAPKDAPPLQVDAAPAGNGEDGAPTGEPGEASSR